MSDDKMRAEFEKWANAEGYDLSQTTDHKYWWAATSEAWRVWQAAYAAGQKAEREAMQKEALQQLTDQAQELWGTEMNVDEAIAYSRRDKDEGFQSHDMHNAMVTLAAEVERLRAELAQFRKDWCNDDEAIKQQALRVLDAAKVEGDSVYVPRMGALAEMMADELVKVRDELAVERAAVESLGDSYDKLRDELWETKVDNTHWEESHYRVEVELAAAKAYIDAQKQSLYGLQKAAIRLGDRLDDAEKELAAAKAASVLPVEAVDCYTLGDDVEVVCKCSEDADCLSGWLRERMKDKTPPQA